jgi:hypothetical protein
VAGRENMNKWAVSIGVVLIVAGLILSSFHNLSRTETFSELAGETDPSKLAGWEYAGNFTAGDIIIVDVLQNIFWTNSSAAYDLVAMVPTKDVIVNITDPKNGVSEFDVVYTYSPDDLTLRQMHTYNITILSLSDGISQDYHVSQSGATFVAGKAMYSGTYTANITDIIPDHLGYRQNGLNPAYFALFKAYNVTSYPYGSTFYIGVGTSAAGIILIVYGLARKRGPMKGRSLKRVPLTRIRGRWTPNDENLGPRLNRIMKVFF